MTENRSGPLTDKDVIVVCDACKRASCWQGKLFCEDYMSAGTQEMTVAELRKLGLEHESYWRQP